MELDVQGTARSTKVLVNEAIKKRSLKTYSEVWVVFDKDDIYKKRPIISN